MNLPTLTNIHRSQEEYRELLLQYRGSIEGSDLSIVQICTFLDEVRCFWLERLKIVELELEEITQTATCFVLSGAVFLNVAEYEHFYFKSLGDVHLLPDPFMKMELFFRRPVDEINHQFTTDYFKRAFLDAIEILTTYKGYFLILPIHELSVDDPEEHRKLLDGFFWSFISTAFKTEFESKEEFCSKYSNYEEIEKDLDVFVLDHLLFNDYGDIKLSMRERTKRYQKTQTNISSRFGSISESQSFLVAVYSHIAQITDILYLGTALKIKPYIRFDVTFNYLTLIMYTFANDPVLREMIEKSLLCYLFRRTISEERFETMEFTEYCKLLENRFFMDTVLDRVHMLNLDIFSDHPTKVISIIEEEFNKILQS
jgi:hypothetical protein